jgi:uncharacterized protein (TIGR03435 family)
MNTTGKIVLLAAALTSGSVSLLCQTAQDAKPAFDVVSIKPSAPNVAGMRGGGARGNRYTMSNATLRMLLQSGYQRISPGTPPGQLQIIGGPNWMDSDRYDVQATVDCSGGVLSRDQLQLMVQSMLEDRFQLKAHMETRELQVYNLVVGKDGAKIKASEDQTPPALGGGAQPCGPAPSAPPPPPPPPPPPFAGERGGPSDPKFTLPRGAMMMMMNPTGLTLQASGVPVTSLIAMLQQQIGRPIIDKTDLKGLFDFKLQFSPEGLNLPGPPGGFAPGGAPPPPGAGPSPPSSADPVPSLFTAIQELGLKFESSKGPVAVLVIDSVQKPKEN